MRLRTAIAAALVIVASGLLTTEATAQITTTPLRPSPSVARPQIARPQSPRPHGTIARQRALAARQRLQQRRIQSGQRRGTISGVERGRLLARQRSINSLSMRLRASDGRLGVRERMQLHRRLNELSRTIRRFGRR
jgi:hypothetical protein